jgi:hypothetical protein
VPENVAQQIIIWEEEKNAIKIENVIYLYEFADEKQFERYMDILKKEKIPILWSSKEKNIMIVPKNSRNTQILNKINE